VITVTAHTVSSSYLAEISLKLDIKLLGSTSFRTQIKKHLD